VIYRLDPNKIPAFLEAESAGMVFNLGSDLNMLKSGEPGKHPDYYRICAAPPQDEHQQSICQQLQLVEQTQRHLKLNFTIPEIASASKHQAELFAWQNEQLQ
jgi:hypothetical protein